jgi:hypothetical protein
MIDRIRQDTHNIPKKEFREDTDIQRRLYTCLNDRIAFVDNAL